MGDAGIEMLVNGLEEVHVQGQMSAEQAQQVHDTVQSVTAEVLKEALESTGSNTSLNSTTKSHFTDVEKQAAQGTSSAKHAKYSVNSNTAMLLTSDYEFQQFQCP